MIPFSILTFSENQFMQLVASTHYSMGYVSAMMDDWERVEFHFNNFIETPIEIANKNFRPWAGKNNVFNCCLLVSIHLRHLLVVTESN